MKRLSLLICVFLIETALCADSKPSIPEIKESAEVVTGKLATVGQFPWQAALFFQKGPNSRFWVCSGSIISSEWILTAAHCANEAESVLVYTGIVDISQDIKPTSIAKEFAIHEKFSPDSFDNDVALIKLPEPLGFNDNTKTISWSSDKIKVGTTVTVSAWGQTTKNGTKFNPVLSYLDLVTISSEECQKLYGNKETINSEMICAASDPSQGTCHGDNGGPVIVGFGRDPQLVALISFVSSEGCEGGYPSGYTTVEPYVDWIKEKTGLK